MSIPVEFMNMSRPIAGGHNWNPPIIGQNIELTGVTAIIKCKDCGYESKGNISWCSWDGTTPFPYIETKTCDEVKMNEALA